jgi:hypothetical protein
MTAPRDRKQPKPSPAERAIARKMAKLGEALRATIKRQEQDARREQRKGRADA